MGLFLIEVYKQAELKPDSSNKGKLLALLRQFDSEEPTRKKFITEMIMYVIRLCWRAKLTNAVGLQGAASTRLANQNYIMLLDHYMRRSTMLMMRSDILRLVRKTHRKCLRSWSMSGIHRTIRTQLRFMLLEQSSHTSSLEMSAMLQNLYGYSRAD